MLRLFAFFVRHHLLNRADIVRPFLLEPLQVQLFERLQYPEGPLSPPQSLQDVQAVFHMAHERFPAAQIVASTMDAFATTLAPIRQQLPAVTYELGDTWIQGVGTDPLKVSQFRELLRLRRRWFAEGRLDPASHESQDFHRALLLVPEHTWGLDVKTHLADFGRYASDELTSANLTHNFMNNKKGRHFSMPVLALRYSQRSNAVSELHGQVARKMWNFLWSKVREEDVPPGSWWIEIVDNEG
jgi:hypothetical protein